MSNLEQLVDSYCGQGVNIKAPFQSCIRGKYRRLTYSNKGITKDGKPQNKLNRKLRKVSPRGNIHTRLMRMSFDYNMRRFINPPALSMLMRLCGKQ